MVQKPNLGRCLLTSDTGGLHVANTNKLHGILLVHKESGITSHDLVDSLRKITGQKEVGHSGTLDPIAEGLMLILLGHGTKLSNYLLNNDKSYFLSFCLGAETDTLDCTGQVLSKKTVQISVKKIERTLNRNQGELTLPVPLFSAVKIKGKKLYHYARAQNPVEPPRRKMFFYDLKLIRIQRDQITVKISCTKGSYIRSWVAFVGRQLRTGAYLASLVRLACHPFYLESALKLSEIKERFTQEDVKNISWKSQLAPAFIPFSESLPHILPIEVSSMCAQQMKHGKISLHLLHALQAIQEEVKQEQKEKIVRVMEHTSGQMIALLQLKVFQAPKILRVFASLP